MKRINIPLVADTLFAGICAFLLFFTAVRFYTRSPIWGLGFGLAAMVLFCALAYVCISRKQDKTLLISRDEKHKKLLALHLSLSSDGYVRRLFKQALGEGAKISGQKVVVGERACFFNFKMQPIGGDDVARIVKYRFEGKKSIYCNSYTAEAADLAAGFLIELTDIGGVYALLKQKELLPEKYVCEEPPKTGAWQKIKQRFTKRLCAPLFWSGAGLMALSYFTFFPLYYIISGSVLLILAAAALFFGGAYKTM